MYGKLRSDETLGVSLLGCFLCSLPLGGLHEKLKCFFFENAKP